MTRTCDIEGCERKHRSRGWCDLHYGRYMRHGDPLYEKPKATPDGLCTLDGCNGKHRGNGLCRSHYDYVYKKRLRGEVVALDVADNPTCMVDGCDGGTLGGGVYCPAHFYSEVVDKRHPYGRVRCGTSRGRDRHVRLGEPFCTRCEYAARDWVDIMVGAA